MTLSTKEAEREQPFTHRLTPVLVYISAVVPAGCTLARSENPRSGCWQGEVIGTVDGAGCEVGWATQKGQMVREVCENGDKQA